MTLLKQPIQHPKPSYHSKKWFSQIMLVIEIINTKSFVKELIQLGLSISNLIKFEIYKFWYKNIKCKHYDDSKNYVTQIQICGFIIQIKNDDYFKDIEDDVGKGFLTTSS